MLKNDKSSSNVVDGIYIDPKFKDTMFRYLDMPKNKKGFFLDLHQPIRMLCAFGRPHQDIPKAVMHIASTVGYKSYSTDIPRYLTEDSIETFQGNLDEFVYSKTDKDKCIIIGDFENIKRSQWSTGMPFDFIDSLKNLAVVNNLMIVVCINGVPDTIQHEFVRKLPVRCLFRPPGTEDREKLFKFYLTVIEKHIEAKGMEMFGWVSWKPGDDSYSDLADYSQFATSGQIKSFVREVYQNILNTSYTTSSRESPLVVDSKFIYKFLQINTAGSQTIDQTLTSKLDHEYFKYAGETTFVEEVEESSTTNDIFAISDKERNQEQPLEGERKRQKVLEIEEK